MVDGMLWRTAGKSARYAGELSYKLVMVSVCVESVINRSVGDIIETHATVDM